jgi:hypothetical protein
MVAIAAVTLVAAYETAAVSNMILILALTLMRRREGRSAFDDLVMFVLLGGIIYQLASAVGGLNSNLEHFLSSLPFLALPTGLALAVIAISWLIPGDRALLLGLAPASVAALVLSVLVRERSTLDFEMLVVRSSYALRVANVATALVVSLLAVFAARLERWISAPAPEPEGLPAPALGPGHRPPADDIRYVSDIPDAGMGPVSGSPDLLRHLG